MSWTARVGGGAMWSLCPVLYPGALPPGYSVFPLLMLAGTFNGLISPAAEAPALEALERELVQLVGHEGVSTSPGVRRKASIDGSTMSPILAPLLPIGLADIVAFPKNATQIAETVAAATRSGVPVTTHGRGKSNYGQGLPLLGGLVLDTSRARAITEVADGCITAEAGTPMVQLERAATEAASSCGCTPQPSRAPSAGSSRGARRGPGRSLTAPIGRGSCSPSTSFMPAGHQGSRTSRPRRPAVPS